MEIVLSYQRPRACSNLKHFSNVLRGGENCRTIRADQLAGFSVIRLYAVVNKRGFARQRAELEEGSVSLRSKPRQGFRNDHVGEESTLRGQITLEAFAD